MKMVNAFMYSQILLLIYNFKMKIFVPLYPDLQSLLNQNYERKQSLKSAQVFTWVWAAGFSS